MKILLIEDDQPTSEILSDFLSTQHYAVDAIADGSAGLDLATQWEYDLILLDFMLPTLNGVEVCRRLRAQGCQTPILMLTVKDANEDVITGLDAGADDYVAKTCAPSQLLARVRALLRRSKSTSTSPVLRWGTLSLDPAAARVTYAQQEIALRPKEYALLELFLRHPHRILSRGAIIDHLWPMEETPVEGSVTSLIKDLRHRLKAAGMKVDLIETVYGLGYRLKSEVIDGSEAPSQGSQPSDRGNSLNSKTAVRAIASQRQQDLPQQGLRRIEQIAQRFQASVESRLAVLEAAARSLQDGHLSPEQRHTTRTEIHKLAGGLGTFGYAEASNVAKAIEELLDHQEPESTQFADEFFQLFQALKRELAQVNSL
jgi:DNA-binding response OmpR family regulator/HPt (histidine-containing phosphotransfer) domain-containing protein